MSPRQKARFVFFLAISLLILSGIAASVSIVNLLDSTKWVAHGYEVKQELSKAESLLTLAGRERAVYLASGDADIRAQFDSAAIEAQREVRLVRELTTDNPVQQTLCDQLTALANERIKVLTSSVNEYNSEQSSARDQATFSGRNLEIAGETTELLDKMQQEEGKLLQRRIQISYRLFSLSIAVLTVMFLASLILIAIHYRMLHNEAGKREQSEESARQLSAQLLRVQDHERRKFSRELHDGLGQSLAVTKWTLSSLLEKNPGDPSIAECVKAIDQAIVGTRTISHLLHPPLLDEAGFESAARWYVEGFSQRSGIAVSLTLKDTGRLPRSVELAFFRVLQESLTNIHKHSKSPSAEVLLRAEKDTVILRVRDFGTGMPAETLENFRNLGTQVGVGLAGMRERIREQGGEFKIDSDANGTTIEVSLPRTAPPGIESEFTDTSVA
jgi:signal transduction histidine kinase